MHRNSTTAEKLVSIHNFLPAPDCCGGLGVIKEIFKKPRGRAHGHLFNH